MAYLFAKDVVQQSLRLGFAGAWEYTHPNLSDPMAIIKEHCPLLLRSFVPPSERIIDNNDKGVQVVQDEYHTSVGVDIKGYAASGTMAEKVLRLSKGVAALSTLPLTSPLNPTLQDAFKEGI
jgi:hypothetical protein